MTARWLEVRFLDYWHIGTGRGGGPGLDARVRRTPAGLPLVPGRTIKGALRAAMVRGIAWGWVDDRVEAWFGTALADSGEADRALEEARFRTQAGAVRVASARLGADHDTQESWELAARGEGRVDLLPGLFAELHQTALEDGVAKGESLRTTEVAVPMTLWAEIEGPADALEDLATVLSLVPAFGSGKRRGLGRVALTLHEERP